uniref:Acyclic terpene utilisation N-terminal domain-containing protein n=1 Tax=Iconisemion striatum TaxID=60296 RepID=A0A1A7WCC7_9TELE
MSGFPPLFRVSRAASGRLSRGGSVRNCVSLCFRAKCLRFGSSQHQHSSSSNRCYTNSTGTRAVRIGCASGFWGDTATSVPQLIYSGNLDFLVFDYLSEITMSLLTAARTKVPDLGYAPDFVHVALAPFINDIHRKGIRIISNAGGVNPLACAEAIQEVVRKAGLDLKVAVVTGDNLMPHRSLLSEVKMADGGRQALPRTLHSMNAYLGAGPIRRCLDLGAHIVVTGRCVDSAVALGPLMHWFGWNRSEFDLLAAGSLAGHLIECGAQSTGGIFTDWHRVPDWDNMGFPVVQCSADGSFVLSKPPRTGGLVSFGTVAEQLVYEIGDPRRYLLPDVTCDFSQVEIQEVPGIEGGAVRVTGAKGSPPSHDYKVCSTYMDGFRATAVCPVGGPRAAEKARRTADSIIRRTRRMFNQLRLDDFSSVHIQVLGAEDTYGPHARCKDSREAVVWIAVHHRQKKALEVFSREVAPAGTGMGKSLSVKPW